MISGCAVDASTSEIEIDRGGGKEDGVGEFDYFTLQSADAHTIRTVEIPSNTLTHAAVAADQSQRIEISIRSEPILVALDEAHASYPLRISLDEGTLRGATQFAEFAFAVEMRAEGDSEYTRIDLGGGAYFQDLTILPRTGSFVGRTIAAPGGWISDTETGHAHLVVDRMAELAGAVELRVLAFPIYQFGSFADGVYGVYVALGRSSDNVGDRATQPGDPHDVYVGCRDLLADVSAPGRGGERCGDLLAAGSGLGADDPYVAFCFDLVRRCVDNTFGR